MIKKFLLAVTFIVMFTICAQASNLVVNGNIEPVGSTGSDRYTPQGPWVAALSFSTGDVMSYGFGSGYPAWYDHTTPTDNSDGSGSLFLYGNQIYSASWAQQSIAVSANTYYTLTFWARMLGNGGEGVTQVDRQVNILVNDGLGGQVDLLGSARAFTANDTWVQYTRSFNSGTATQITLKFDYAPGGSGYSNVGVDDVSLASDCDSAGDFNHDCYVNFKDFVIFASAWLTCTDPANVNCH